MAKTNKTGMSPGEIILVSLDLGLTEKPEPRSALGFEPAKTGRAEFRRWARKREMTPEDLPSRFKLMPGGNYFAKARCLHIHSQQVKFGACTNQDPEREAQLLQMRGVPRPLIFVCKRLILCSVRTNK